MKKFTALLLIVIVLCLGVFTITHAADETLSQGQTHDGIFLKAGDSVTIAGTVNGDVWVAGTTVDVSGNINGSLYAAGDHIRIHGNVSGNVHVAGSDVQIDGTIGGSVYGAGSDINVANSAKVGRAAALAGSTLEVKGLYGDNVYLAASTISFGGQTTSNVRADTSALTLTDQAKVGGDLRYLSDSEATIPNDKAIVGRLTHDVPKTEANAQWKQRLWNALYLFLASVLTGAVCLLIIPDQLLARAQVFRRLPIQNILRGLVFILLVPVAIVFLVISLIGIPLAVIVGLGYLAVLLLATIAIGLVIGIQVSGTAVDQVSALSYWQQVQLLTIGLLIISIIGLIPYIGGVLSFVLYLSGIGTLIARTKPAAGTPKATKRVA